MSRPLLSGSTAKAPITGLLDRNGAPSVAAYSGIVRPVINLNWTDLQANGLGPLLASGTAIIDAAVAAGIAFKVRLFCGKNAPADVKTLFDGSPPLLTDGTTVFPVMMVDQAGSAVGAHGTVGWFWGGGSYRAALLDLYVKLAGYRPLGGPISLDGHPLCLDVTFSEPSTIYSEFGKRQLVDQAQPGNINAMTALQLVGAGFGNALDQAEIMGCISDALNTFKQTPISFAYNPYENLLKKTGPRAITASDNSTITTNGTPWGVNDYSGMAAAAIRGRYRITGIAGAVVTCNAAGSTQDFTVAVNGIDLVGAHAWIGGVFYLVTARTAKTVTLNASPPGNENGGVLILWPTAAQLGRVDAAYDSYGSLGVISNSASVLTIPNLATTANAFIGLELFTMSESNQEGKTYGFMVASRASASFARAVETNNGVRETSLWSAGYSGASGVDTFKDLQLIGAPRGCQTAGTGSINGSDLTTARPLKVTIAGAIAAGFSYLEMPIDYLLISRSTVTGSRSIANGAVATFKVTPSPAWSKDDFGTSAPLPSGLYGLLRMTVSGNVYFCSNHGASFADTLDLWQADGSTPQVLLAADQGAGLDYTVESPDYLTPAECAAYNAQFAAVPVGAVASRLPVLGQGRPASRSSAFL